MAIVCLGCGEYVETKVEKEKEIRICPDCGYEEKFKLLPLFIITGASGVGKTTIVKRLREVLTDSEIFDTDEMHAADWQQARSNWLKVAFQIAQSGRHTVLCGTMMRHDIEDCDHFRFFRHVYYINLHCDDAARESRLRARPQWRGVTEEFIADHKRFAQWLLDNAAIEYEPPMPTIDNTNINDVEAARQISSWVNHWR
ncbi:hypothetical protein ACFPYJ_30930 [Paenibacillus solisilvae]|uniref:Nucleoside kinase n=1 Tax=Paenibacillus solisilvae TaxID=2486751 RepID=A0ABW0W9S7_9BACL